MHLSIRYVANYLGLDEADVIQMESGKRDITDEEAYKLTILFNVSAENPFEKIEETDENEIIKLIQFKEYIKKRRNKDGKVY